jgi:hypothetical protein
LLVAIIQSNPIQSIMATSGASSSFGGVMMPSLDFEALLSREYRPARVTRLQPRESFVPPPSAQPSEQQQQQQQQQKKKKKSGSVVGDNSQQQRQQQQQQQQTENASSAAAAASAAGVMIPYHNSNNYNSSNDIFSTSTGGGTIGSAVGAADAVMYTITPQDLQRQEETRRLVLSLVTQTPEFLMHLEDDERQRVLSQRNNIVQKSSTTSMFLLPSSSSSSSSSQLYQQPRRVVVVDPKFSEVNLSDWQSKIDWGGGGPDDDDSDSDNHDDEDGDDGEKGDNNDNNDVQNDHEQGHEEEENNYDNHEQQYDDDDDDNDDDDDDDDDDDSSSSEASTVELSDPRLLLHCPRNPFLDHLVFDETTVCWNGDDDELLARAARAPLILELGVAGRSVAKKLYQNTVLSAQRPLPATRHLAYEARMDRDWCGSDEYHALLLAEDAASNGGTGTGTFAGSMADISRGTLHHDKEKMEALIQARQVRRAQMAKDKTNRVSAALGTLALGGGRGRAVTSSLMGPGGTERTGRYVSCVYIVCCCCCHDV